jgi:hypothetical protein
LWSGRGTPDAIFSKMKEWSTPFPITILIVYIIIFIYPLPL